MQISKIFSKIFLNCVQSFAICKLGSQQEYNVITILTKMTSMQYSMSSFYHGHPKYCPVSPKIGCVSFYTKVVKFLLKVNYNLKYMPIIVKAMITIWQVVEHVLSAQINVKSLYILCSLHGLRTAYYHKAAIVESAIIYSVKYCKHYLISFRLLLCTLRVYQYESLKTLYYE